MYKPIEVYKLLLQVERIPLLAKEGWTRPQKNAAKPPLIGADGHERSECEPDRAKRGMKVAHKQSYM